MLNRVNSRLWPFADRQLSGTFLFAGMQHNSTTAMEFFKLPPSRVVELGSQVEI